MRTSPGIANIVIPVRLMADREVSSTAKLLYGLIDYYAMMSGGICYETNASLASWMCDISIGHIRKLLVELRNAGYIRTVNIPGYHREIYICE